MKPLNIALSLIPLLAVAIGMITWIVTLRADLDATKSNIVSLMSSQNDMGLLSERLIAVETSINSIPNTTDWRNDMGERIVAIESIPPISVKPYDDSWLLDKFSGLDTAEKNLAIQNEEAMTTITWIISEYGPAIDNLRNRELDTNLSDRLGELSREVSTVAAKVDSLDIPDYGNISSRLGAMEAIVDTINGGEIDLTPLVSRIAELEGNVRSLSTSSNIYDDSAITRQIAALEGSVSSLQTTVKDLPRSSGTSYNDSAIRRQIVTLQSDVSSIESSISSLSSGGSSSYNDSSLRASIRTLTNNVATLETTVRNLPSDGTTYNDSSIRSSISSVESTISSLQSQINNLNTLDGEISSLSSDVSNLESQISNAGVGEDFSGDIALLFSKIVNLDSWLEDIDSKVSETDGTNEINDLYAKVADLEYEIDMVASSQTTTATVDVSYLENDIIGIRGELEDLYDSLGGTFDYLFDELESLQDTVNFLASGSSDNSSGNTSSSNTTYVPEKLYVDHATNSNQYNGTYVQSGNYNGYPMWKCEECGPTSGQFATTYLFRYPVGFTLSGWVWVVQPIPPSTDWSANSYLDAEWPWEGANWDGDVTYVEIS